MERENFNTLKRKSEGEMKIIWENRGALRRILKENSEVPTQRANTSCVRIVPTENEVERIRIKIRNSSTVTVKLETRSRRSNLEHIHHSQLKSRNQKIKENLQEFENDIERTIQCGENSSPKRCAWERRRFNTGHVSRRHFRHQSKEKNRKLVFQTSAIGSKRKTSKTKKLPL